MKGVGFVVRIRVAKNWGWEDSGLGLELGLKSIVAGIRLGRVVVVVGIRLGRVGD